MVFGGIHSKINERKKAKDSQRFINGHKQAAGNADAKPQIEILIQKETSKSRNRHLPLSDYQSFKYGSVFLKFIFKLVKRKNVCVMSLIMQTYVPFGHLQKWIAWKTASSSHKASNVRELSIQQFDALKELEIDFSRTHGRWRQWQMFDTRTNTHTLTLSSTHSLLHTHTLTYIGNTHTHTHI